MRSGRSLGWPATRPRRPERGYIRETGSILHVVGMGIKRIGTAYWKAGIDLELVLPIAPDMEKLFQNTNWAHLIDFRDFEESRFRGYTHAPAIRFTNGIEQTKAVDRVLDILLAALLILGETSYDILSGPLMKLLTNVMNHSQSSIGGLVQVTNHRHRERIELVVADSGIGIPASLRPTHPAIQTDTEALHAAIQEGVTRDKNVGQGNGLYGTWSICQKTDGDFSIRSGYASLLSPRQAEVSSTRNLIPFNGTVVVAKIGYSDRFDLSQALVFSGRIHVPTDYIETHFNEDGAGNIIFVLGNESHGFGSRTAGDPVRRKLINVVSCLDNGRVMVDLSGVNLLSSSYADEVFGKLFVELGPMNFMGKIQLVNVDPLVKNLVDRAITQRMQTG